MYLVLTASLVLGQAPTPDLRLEAQADGRRLQLSATLPGQVAVKISQGRCPQDQAETVLRLVRVDPKTAKEGPPLLGIYELTGQDLGFRHRFDLEPDTLYRGILILSGGKRLEKDYRTPRLREGPPARVVKILPSADVLPANVLRFYIYFSRPIRGGSEIFKQIKLLDGKDNVITDPWLIEELWDDKTNCLILYIHPGRIKWGVLLRELLGPVCLPLQEYRLVIPADLLDDRGQRLGKDYVKKFRTTAEDRVAVDTAAWKIAKPRVDSLDPVIVNLLKPVDHRSLKRFIDVLDSQGLVKGKISIGRDEKSWSFTPQSKWQATEYTLRIDARLEDVAGNTPGRPFDLDLKAPPPPPPRLSLKFQPK